MAYLYRIANDSLAFARGLEAGGEKFENTYAQLPGNQIRQIRIALAGCGRIAANHFDSIETHGDCVELVELCDINSGALEQAVCCLLRKPGRLYGGYFWTRGCRLQCAIQSVPPINSLPVSRPKQPQQRLWPRMPPSEF